MTRREKPKGSFTPVIGFIIIVILGGIGFVTADDVVHYLTTASPQYGALADILPMTLPPAMYGTTGKFIFAGVIFFVGFVALMFVLLLLAGDPNKGDEAYVDIHELRKEFEKKGKKGKKKR